MIVPPGGVCSGPVETSLNDRMDEDFAELWVEPIPDAGILRRIRA